MLMLVKIRQCEQKGTIMSSNYWEPEGRGPFGLLKEL